MGIPSKMRLGEIEDGGPDAHLHPEMAVFWEKKEMDKKKERQRQLDKLGDIFSWVLWITIVVMVVGLLRNTLCSWIG